LLLVAPLPPEVKALQNWIISPDGPLALLPFDTLELDGEALMMRYQISSVQSLSMLKLLRERGSEYSELPRETLLAVGDPIYQLAQQPAIETARPAAG